MVNLNEGAADKSKLATYKAKSTKSRIDFRFYYLDIIPTKTNDESGM